MRVRSLPRRGPVGPPKFIHRNPSPSGITNSRPPLVDVFSFNFATLQLLLHFTATTSPLYSLFYNFYGSTSFLRQLFIPRLRRRSAHHLAAQPPFYFVYYASTLQIHRSSAIIILPAIITFPTINILFKSDISEETVNLSQSEADQ